MLRVDVSRIFRTRCKEYTKNTTDYHHDTAGASISLPFWAWCLGLDCIPSNENRTEYYLAKITAIYQRLAIQTPDTYFVGVAGPQNVCEYRPRPGWPDG